MTEEDKRLDATGREAQLIKHVFSNDKGRELLALWGEIFNKRSTYHPGNTPQDTAYNEGLRMFYQTIQSIFDEETK